MDLIYNYIMQAGEEEEGRKVSMYFICCPLLLLLLHVHVNYIQYLLRDR